MILLMVINGDEKGGSTMAYFLKKSYTKKGTYIQICESFYSRETKDTKHKIYKTLGYVDDLRSDKIPDPVEYWEKQVKILNEKVKQKKAEARAKKVGEARPLFNVGYFLLKKVFHYLDPSEYFGYLVYRRKLQYDFTSLIEGLTYARVVNPCSKLKTYLDVLPQLYDDYDFSLDQIYDGIEIIGREYERIIEILNDRIMNKFKTRNTSKVYFDCTNFYFEIDYEDDLRRKGVSKERRLSSLIGMGLLLDADNIPLCMKLYPGNESEIPILREVIKDMKERHCIKGRTIQVADKGLNCGKNILKAKNDFDGYIYSQSVKELPQAEKTWVLLNNDYKVVYDKLDKKKIAFRYKSCIDEFEYSYFDDNGKKKKFKTQQLRIVTYNPELAKKQIYEINKLVEKAREACVSKAKKSEMGACSKYVNIGYSDEDGEVKKSNTVSINYEKIEEDKMLAGYNLLVTSELKMKPLEVYKTYHNLWNIEEDFKLFKSQLEARPVYLQKEDSIYGHFLICYISVLLIRLLQYKFFNNELCASQIVDFIREFEVVPSEKKYINTLRKGKLPDTVANLIKQPIDSYFLEESLIKKLLKI